MLLQEFGFIEFDLVFNLECQDEEVIEVKDDSRIWYLSGFRTVFRTGVRNRISVDGVVGLLTHLL